MGIGDASALPSQHNLTHRAPNGFVSTYDLDFEVETASTEPVNAWRGRLNGRPFPNGTAFGTVPEVPVDPIPSPAPPVPPASTRMDIDPLIPDPATIIQHPIEQSRSSASAPPLHRTFSTSNPQLVSLALPRRRGGIVIEENPIPRPVVGSTPVTKDKGKKPVSGCKNLEPTVNDYDSDESDEGSFERALNAINGLGRDAGSSSGVEHASGPSNPPTSSTTPPYHQKSDQHSLPLLEQAQWQTSHSGFPHDSERGHPSEIPITGSETPPNNPLSLEQHIQLPPLTPSDTDSEPIANIVARIIDEEPLSARAHRLQAKILGSHSKKNMKPTPPQSLPFTVTKRNARKVTYTKLPRPRRQPSLSPVKDRSHRSSKNSGAASHNPRSPTKKSCSSSVIPPLTPAVIEISDTSTEYPPDPPFANEWRYNPSVPRRSFRVQMQHTHTPILQRAQKRKTTGNSKPAGNPLLHHFPYTRLTVEQIIQLFQVYNITLGRNPQERELLILAIQKLNRQQFDSILTTLNTTSHSTEHQILQLSDLSPLDTSLELSSSSSLRVPNSFP